MSEHQFRGTELNLDLLLGLYQMIPWWQVPWFFLMESPQGKKIVLHIMVNKNWLPILITKMWNKISHLMPCCGSVIGATGLMDIYPKNIITRDYGLPVILVNCNNSATAINSHETLDGADRSFKCNLLAIKSFTVHDKRIGFWWFCRQWNCLLNI